MSAPSTPVPSLPPTATTAATSTANATAATATATATTMAPATARLDWRLRFAVLSVIWGFSFLLIKVGTEAYAPFQVALGRVFFGALALLTVLLIRREPLPRGRRTWAHLSVAALLLNTAPFSLFAYAELSIPSSLAGICNATSPLWGMALSLVALSEDRPTRRRFAGLGLGFIGVLTVLGAWQGFSGLDAKGTALALLAALCYPIGWIYVRRTLASTPGSPVALTGAQLLVSTLQLAAVSVLFTSAPTSFPLWPTLSVIALGALGTGMALQMQYGLVTEIGPTTAQMVTYFIPVIATTAGVLLLDEQLHWNTPVGAAVVLAGAALTQTRRR
ncbi:DMT family transporter [Streptomyces sp. NBC_00335]|uniref:DMT family transporter n=1 Tax=unclassified Streptomyces TaxID=2593676 RepID=UPI0022569AB9|nr:MULTISPECIES: DMT family transporter [unclassified Streptomyces]MCX5408652.1 DMT family transporter [Streptomyces sp. NBC_00086]